MNIMILNENVIERILKIEWLKNCRNLSISPTQDCIRTDGSNVFSKASRNTWDNTRLEARGLVTGYLAVHAPKEFNPYWNPLVHQVRNQIWPRTEVALKTRVKQLGLPEFLTESIEFDVINMAVVLSYQEIVRSPFYENLLSTYCEGFLPCGWEGEYPNGCMIVM